MSSSEDSASAELGRGNPAHGAEGNRPRNSPSGGADFDAVKEAALKGAKKKHLHAVVVLPDKEGNPQARVATKLTREEKSTLLSGVFEIDGNDQMRLVEKVQGRLSRVGMAPPTILVRYHAVTVTATVVVGSVTVPTIGKATKSPIDPILRHRSLRRFKLAPRTETYPILDDLSGIIYPGRLTLLLGPPGSGKSTFLKTLAGYNRREAGLKIRAEELTYNGHSFNEFVVERSSAYVGQIENHYGELTVRETFDFAARCQSSGYRRGQLEELLRREKEAGVRPDPEIEAFMMATSLAKGARSSLMVELVIRLLGLEVCADTLVGNAMLRGISGGQKKRVTTGELIVGPARAMFMDEISTGLDSNTTFTIIRALQNLAHVLKATVLVGLLQPGPETFDLFDDVILIASARTPFHGPREDALPFFESLGFACPGRVGVADFLQEIASPADQGKYWDPAHGRPYEYHPVAFLSEAWQAGPYWRGELAKLAQPADRDAPGARGALHEHRYGEAVGELLRANLWRWWMLQRRMIAFTIFRTVQMVIMALVVGTTFLRMRRDSVVDGLHFYGVMFFSLLYMMLPTLADMHLLIPRLSVVFRQRNAHFYPGWSFALAPIVLRMPFSFLEATLWTNIVYWLCGFTTSGRVVMFWFQLFAYGVWSAIFFSTIAALIRDDTIGTAFNSFFLIVFMNVSGLILNPQDIPGWWLGGFWGNPMAYAFRALAVNEFTSSEWNPPNPLYPGVKFGTVMLELRGFDRHYWWTWVSFVFLFGTSVVNAIVFLAALTFLDAPHRVPVLSEELLEEIELGRQNSGLIGGRSGKEAGSDLVGKAKAEAKSVADDHASGDDADEPPTTASGGGDGKDVASLSPRISLGMQERAISQRSQDSEREAARRRAELFGSARLSYRLEAGERLDASREAGEQYKERTALPFSPSTLTFRNVEYSVPVPPSADRSNADIPAEGPHAGSLRLLNDIEGVFRPHVLTALMGASGAGKTTLMDVLASRKTGGKITGDIRVNGYPQVPKTFARVLGYVEQTDIHIPQTTVEEALQFSAALRLPFATPQASKQAFVTEILELVELDRLANAYVGAPGHDGLSVEQRKRLTLAVELVANPSIVFMDEPTSGLDARAANIVMRAVRNTVDSGRTVVCTIHQPNIDIFQAFDELLLLKPGGRTIYNGLAGADSAKLITYFEGIAGVVPIKPRYNPANWMLEETNPQSETRLGVDFHTLYRGSVMYTTMQELLAANETPKEGVADLEIATLDVGGPWHQFLVILRRNLNTYWRCPEYNVTRFGVTLMVALFFGSLFYKMGQRYTSASDVFNLMGAIYSSSVFLGIINALIVQHVIAVSRTVFYRERAAGFYAVLPYGAAQQLVEIPYVLVQGTVYVVVCYWMMDFAHDAGKFFWYWCYFTLTLLFATFFGIMGISLVPNVAFASNLCNFLVGFWNLMAGFLIFKPEVPGWWIWAFYTNPYFWSVYGLIVSQLGDLDQYEIIDFYGDVRTIPDFLKNAFSYTYVLSQGPIIAILLGFSLLFTGFTIFALFRLNFQNR